MEVLSGPFEPDLEPAGEIEWRVRFPLVVSGH